LLGLWGVVGGGCFLAYQGSAKWIAYVWGGGSGRVGGWLGGVVKW